MMGTGRRFRVELFGSSHGPEVGVVVEGIPSGRRIATGPIQAALDRRRPLGRRLATKRAEADRLVIDAGLARGRSTGGPFRAHVANTDIRREPYDRLHDTPRPGHADYPARVRFGPAADLSGGGIFSGRMTVGLVIAGAVASQLLAPSGIDVVAFTRAIGDAVWAGDPPGDMGELRKRIGSNETGCPDPVVATEMERAIASARREGDSLGGVVEVRATGLPVGLGEPFFGSVESWVAGLAFSIPGVKGVEFGAGFAAARMRGSAHNDPFRFVNGHVVVSTNHAGGILGGLATGAPLVARVAVKPTASIARRQSTVNLSTGENTEIVVTGRHDPCIVPRAVPVVEAVTWIALTDLALAGGFLS